MACCVLLAALIAGLLGIVSLLGGQSRDAAHRWRLDSKDSHGEE